MSITLENHILKLRRKLAGFQAFSQTVIARETNTVLTNVKQRVREQGVPGESYSEGYSAFRKKKGRQTSKVDLNFSGRMLNNTQIQKVEPTGQSNITSFVGPSQSGEKDKFKANQKRYGNFLKLTDEDKKNFQKHYVKSIIDYMND